MTIDTNQFWNLLTQSQLLPQPQVQTLFTQASSNSDRLTDQTAKNLADWLVEQNAISEYQAKILLAGHDGPFHYGNYTVISRFEKGELPGSFKAIHRKSRHQVLLEFLTGNQAADLKHWQTVESLADSASEVQHVNLLAIYESVALPSHRFVVCEYPHGVPLATKLPRKSRLPWEKAALIVAQITRATQSLHAAGIRHGSISPRTIWIQKNGQVQLRLPVQLDPSFESVHPDQKGHESKFHYLPPEWSRETDKPTKRGDTYAIGCVLYRALTGRVPFTGVTADEIMKQHRGGQIPDLQKYSMPQPLLELLHQLLDKDAAKRPADLTNVAQRLINISGGNDVLQNFKIPNSSSLAEFRRSLNQFKPGTEQKIASVPEIQTVSDSTDPTATQPVSPEVASVRAEKINAAAEAASRRKQNRWKLPAAVAAALTLFALIIGALAFNASRTVVQVPPAAEKETAASDKNGEALADDPKTQLNFAAMPESERPIVLQNLIADDNDSLWETPTTGPPLQLQGLPTAPKLIFAIRLKELANNAEGQRIIQGLGPEFQSLLLNWKKRCGLEFEDVDQLVVSLHTNEDFLYDAYFTVQLAQPLEFDRLIAMWNRPTAKTTESGQTYLTGDTDAFYILQRGAAPVAESNRDQSDSTAASGDEDRERERQLSEPVSKFAFGAHWLIEDVANNAGLSALAGPLLHLAESTDRDRHFNFLFLRTALFNDEGQKLMGNRLRAFNRELSVMLTNDVRAGLFSFHLDNGTYVELGFERDLGISPDDLRTMMVDQFRTDATNSRSSSPRFRPAPTGTKSACDTTTC